MTSPGATGPTPAPEPAGEVDPASGRSPRQGRGYWVPAVIAMTALVAIGLALGAGDLDHGGVSTLHGPDVASNIALAIQAEKDTHALPDVRCPPSEPVRDGWRFVCSMEQGGSSRPIQVTEIDGRGHLQWQFGS
jgi:hypothetical protein